MDQAGSLAPARPAPSPGPDPAAALAAIRSTRRRGRWWTGALAVGAVVAAAVALGTGPVAIAPAEVLDILAGRLSGRADPPGQAGALVRIVWDTRLPRVAMALVAGAVLAVAGAVLQALVRNGLADPYVLGLNSGASTGAALVIVLVGGGSALLLAGAALAGAVGAIAVVLLLAGVAGRRGPFRLVLAGLAVGYGLTAVTNFLIFWSDSPEAARSVLFWLLGSLAGIDPVLLAAGAGTAALGIGALVAAGPWIDALASGDDSARSAGICPERARFAVLAGTSAMVGVVVAAVGGIGFIGLVVPHLARRLVGGRHRAVLPVSALLGAILLASADAVARTALAPQEIPVGVVTGILGAPLLLLLLRRALSTRVAP